MGFYLQMKTKVCVFWKLMIEKKSCVKFSISEIPFSFENKKRFYNFFNLSYF